MVELACDWVRPLKSARLTSRSSLGNKPRHPNPQQPRLAIPVSARAAQCAPKNLGDSWRVSAPWRRGRTAPLGASTLRAGVARDGDAGLEAEGHRAAGGARLYPADRRQIRGDLAMKGCDWNARTVPACAEPSVGVAAKVPKRVPLCVARDVLSSAG